MPTETISQYYQEDHGRLDRLFNAFRDCKTNELEKATQLFEEFMNGLICHIRWEEEILFPRFEEKTDMRDSGPTAVMRTEHRQIEHCLNTIYEKLQAGDMDVAADAEQVLLILKHHNHKEERVLYPGIDQLLSTEETAAVFDEMGVTTE